MADGVVSVGWIHKSWVPMCEDVGLECIKVEDVQGVLVFLAEFVTHGLCLYHMSIFNARGGTFIRRSGGTPR